MIGYQAKIVSGLSLSEGGILVQDVTLSAQIIEVEAISVAAGAEAGSVDAALEKQRTATNIVNEVTAEQIARSPDSDAGQAVQRVSGVTVQDGKFVFVRGLGERYTTTSLNGARVPSPEPERKVVPLDLFPSNLLEGVTTSKTFTPDQPGDFSGAAVDLHTREFPAGRVFTLSTTAGLNSAVTGRNGVFAPTVGGEWRAVAGSARSLPSAITDLPAGASLAQQNAALATFRRSWLGDEATGSGNGGVSISLGGEDPMFGRLIGYIASFGYSSAQEVRHDEQRARAIDGDGQTGGESTIASDVERGTTTRTSVLMGGMLNASTRIGATSKLSFNNTFTRGGDNEAGVLGGVIEEFGQPLLSTRLDFTSRTVRSNQVAGEHLFGARHTVSWQVTNAAVSRYEPDRSDYKQQGTMGADSLVSPTMWYGSGRSATRTFSDLRESSWNFGVDYKLFLGEAGRGPSVKVGLNRRSADRDVTNEAYQIYNVFLDDTARAGTPAAVFSDAHFADSSFGVNLDTQVGNYTASDRTSAGYLMAEVPLGSHLRIIGGARVEVARIHVTTALPNKPDTTTTLDNTDVLPSLALNYAVSETQNVRFSATQTLARPEYRELSPTTQRGSGGADVDVFGNVELQRTLIQNFDLRWELFPRRGEVVSLGVFYKHFDHPIEKVPVANTGATALSFVNAREGYNVGLELELRKNLDFLGAAFGPFSAFSNVTLVRSRVSFDSGQTASANADKRAMLGQAPYVVNAGLAWNTASG
ncbi:MAG TPA: TonB-dependent receptor, partial [Gemmatimonadales bacterium]